jgi:hypothetical protein
MTPSLPPLQFSTSASSKSGDVAAPNTVYFGGFGAGSGGGGFGSLDQYMPYLAIGAVALVLLKRKH